MSDRMPDPNPTPDLVPLIGVRRVRASEPIDWHVWEQTGDIPQWVPLPPARMVRASDPGGR